MHLLISLGYPYIFPHIEVCLHCTKFSLLVQLLFLYQLYVYAPYLSWTQIPWRLWQAYILRQMMWLCYVNHWCDLCRCPDIIVHPFTHMYLWGHNWAQLLCIWHRFTHAGDANNENFLWENRPSSENGVGVQDVRVCIKVLQ